MKFCSVRKPERFSTLLFPFLFSFKEDRVGVSPHVRVSGQLLFGGAVDDNLPGVPEGTVIYINDVPEAPVPDWAKPRFDDSEPISAHERFLRENFNEMIPYYFYRELFPKGELDAEGEFNKGKYTAIAVRIFEEGNKVHRYTVCDDLALVDRLCCCNDFCVMAPVSFAGKSQRQANARNLYAVVFDLDGLLETEDGRSKSLINLFAHIELGLIPKPSHIVFSGTGLHLYYMLERPLPLFPNVMKSLAAYRSCLVKKIWNPYITSLSDKPQFESVTQGFRMVGTKAKGNTLASAFKVGGKVSVDYLNNFADEESKIDLVKYVSKTSISEAREKWPDWYEQRIVQGAPRGTWRIKRDLYEWWKRRIKEDNGATVGHRYFCIMALAVYARKCAVPYEELEKDAIDLIPFLNNLDRTGNSPFTASDVVKALEAYDASYITFPRHTIEELTGVAMSANKRNGRSQAIHIKYMNNQREFKVGLGECTNGGRPKGSVKSKTPKGEQIKAYAKAHSDANHSEIARALGVSRPTVIKWLKK